MVIIKAAIVDLNGIVVTDGTASCVKIWGEQYGDNNVRQVFYGDLGNQLRSGKIKIGQFFFAVKEALNATQKPEELEEEWKDSFTPIVENIKTIHELQGLTCDIITRYLTNSPRELLRYIDSKYGNNISGAFSYDSAWFNGVHSEEYGLIKPDRHLFEASIDMYHANSSPERTLVVDHNPKILQAAAEYGFNTFLYENPRQFRDGLREEFDIPLEYMEGEREVKGKVYRL